MKERKIVEKSLEMSGLKSIDYLNAHGTSPTGDPIELNAIKSVFKDDIPIVSSTKSLGHTLGAAGVQSVFTAYL